MSKHTQGPLVLMGRPGTLKGFSLGVQVQTKSGQITSHFIAHTIDGWKNAEEDARRLITCYNACEGMDNPEMEIAVLRAKVADMEDALEAAATSMETIERLAGRDEYMEDMSQVRGYAANRAKVARAAIKSKEKAEKTIESVIKAKSK